MIYGRGCGQAALAATTTTITTTSILHFSWDLERTCARTEHTTFFPRQSSYLLFNLYSDSFAHTHTSQAREHKSTSTTNAGPPKGPTACPQRARAAPQRGHLSIFALTRQPRGTRCTNSTVARAPSRRRRSAGLGRYAVWIAILDILYYRAIQFCLRFGSAGPASSHSPRRPHHRVQSIYKKGGHITP